MKALPNFLSCDECQSLLPKHVGRRLDLYCEWLINEHLSRCETCFERYFALVEDDVRKNRKESYLAGRPQPWSPPWDVGKEKSICDEVIARALLPAKDGDSQLTIIKYDKALERVAFLLLLRIAAALRNRDKRVRLFSSLTDCFLYPEELKLLKKPLYLVFLGTSGFCNALESLQKLVVHKGIQIIAGWPNDRWGELTFPANYTIYSLALGARHAEVYGRALHQEIESQQALLKKDIRELYLYVCLLDAHGIASPVPLLARLTRQSEERVTDQLWQAIGLVYPVEARFQSVQSFCTAGEPIARVALNKLFKDEVEQGYSQIIEAIDSDNKDERYVLLRLFHALSLSGKRRLAKRLLRQHAQAIARIWQRGDAQEVLLWGKTHHELFLYEESEAIFQHGLEKDRGNPYLLQAFAAMLYDCGKPEEGAKLFYQADEADPGNVYVWQSWGDKERRLGNMRYAEERLKKALRLDPRNVYTLVSYGILELDKGDLDKAESRLNEALSIAPRNLYALNCLGELAKRKGEFVRARELFNQVLDIDPANVPTMHALGQLERERGHLRKAEELFKQILERFDEDNIRALHALGEIELERGRLSGKEGHYRVAEQYFNTVLEIEPENVSALVSLAMMETYRGNYKKAEEFLLRALKRQPGSLYVLVALAEVMMRQQRYAEARNNLEAVLGRAPQNVPALNSYARLCAAKGEFEPAVRIFEKARQIEPRNVVTRNTWAEIEATRWGFDRALQLIDEALELDRENAYTYWQYALILERQGRHEEAQEQFRKAIELGMDV